MARKVIITLFLSVFPLAILVSQAEAKRPASETLLPKTTKSFLSVADMDLLRKQWGETQMGKLAKDPVMKPFIDDFQQQVNKRLLKIGVRLGLTWEDLEDVYGGEVSLATVQPAGDKTKHAMALVVDITGHEKQTDTLLKKVAGNLTNKRGTEQRITVGNARGKKGILVIFTMPKKEDARALKICYTKVDNFLIATDDQSTAEEIMKAALGEKVEPLADVERFRNVMIQLNKSAGQTAPHFRWFVEPLGYAQVARAAAGGKKKRGTDILKVLANQGFTAIQSVGGYVNFMTDAKHEVLHRTMIYAPPVPGAGKDRYKLAARMLDFPVSKPGDSLLAQPWVPREISTYLSFNWNIQAAFEHSASLVDELAGAKGTFDDVLESLEKDPKGPQVNLRKNLVKHLSERSTLITDYTLPITPQSERVLLAIKLNNDKAVRKILSKIMRRNRKAKAFKFQGHTIWEITNDTKKIAKNDVAVELQIGGPGFRPLDEEEEEEFVEEKFEVNIVVPGYNTLGAPISSETLTQRPAPKKAGNAKPAPKKLITSWAVTVAHGHLIVSTHADFIVKVLKPIAKENRLNQAADYRQVNQALAGLGASRDSLRTFSRTDEANRTTYELLRTGKMPEAETLVGKFLNKMLESDGGKANRKQQIDGSKLPKYQAVSRSLGPAGLFMRTEKDGWMVTGCILKK